MRSSSGERLETATMWFKESGESAALSPNSKFDLLYYSNEHEFKFSLFVFILCC